MKMAVTITNLQNCSLALNDDSPTTSYNIDNKNNNGSTAVKKVMPIHLSLIVDYSLSSFPSYII